MLTDLLSWAVMNETRAGGGGGELGRMVRMQMMTRNEDLKATDRNTRKSESRATC